MPQRRRTRSSRSGRRLVTGRCPSACGGWRMFWTMRCSTAKWPSPCCAARRPTSCREGPVSHEIIAAPGRRGVYLKDRNDCRLVCVRDAPRRRQDVRAAGLVDRPGGVPDDRQPASAVHAVPAGPQRGDRLHQAPARWILRADGGRAGDPDSFTRFRLYLAHFSPVFSRLLRVFTASPTRFQRDASWSPGPRDTGKGAQTPFLRPS